MFMNTIGAEQTDIIKPMVNFLSTGDYEQT